MAMQDIEHKTAELQVYFVELNVISCHGLASKDISNKPDIFVKIKIGDTEKETKVIKSSSNPVFNAKYSFEFFQNPQNISFQILNKTETSDHKLGFAEFNLGEQFNSKDSKPFNGHLKLNRKNKKKAKGTLKVRIVANKLLPFSLQKIAQQQKNTIYQQNVQIDNLTKQNTELISRKPIIENNEPGSNIFVQKQPTLKTKKQNYISQIFRAWQIILSVIYNLPLIGYYLDLFVLFLGSMLRLESGYHVFPGATSSKRPPNKLLKLYEYEGSVQCKMVRETLCALDLDCIIYPCPGPDELIDLDNILSSSRYRGEARKLCGKSRSTNFPILIDENYGDDGPLILLNSRQIIGYLYDEYGNKVEKTRLERVRYYVANHKILVWIYEYFYLFFLRCLPEQGQERYVSTAKANNLLELWSYEASPFCVKVREVLSSLEIAYILKNVAVGSQQKKQEFEIRFGKKYPKWRQKLHLMQVPLLVDPNTEREIFESEDIKQYLIKTYCIAQ